jgi:hypothetical protein
MSAFKDLPDGTWFISAKVENDEVWNKIKSGEVKGFSVEGIFNFLRKPKLENEIYNILNATYVDICRLKESEVMQTVKNMIATFKQTFLGEPIAPVAPVAPVAPANLGNGYTLKDGTQVNISELAVGGAVMIGDVPAPAGEYELEDGTKVTVGDGGLIMVYTPAVVAEQAMTEQRVNELISAAIQTIMDANRATMEAETKLTNDQNAAMIRQIKGLFEVVEELAKSATADPIEPIKKSFVSEKSKTRDEALAQLQKNLSFIKKAS